MGTDVRMAAVALLAVIVYGGVLMLQPLEPKLLVSFTDICWPSSSRRAAPPQPAVIPPQHERQHSVSQRDKTVIGVTAMRRPVSETGPW